MVARSGDLRRICLTVQRPATQSTSKICMLYIRLQHTYYDNFRGLNPYLSTQAGSQAFVFNEWLSDSTVEAL